jgi:hypothetical protein
MRVLAFLVLLAVLPTVEVTEQVSHFVEHAFLAEVPDHPVHHDESQGDEHGCTGLIHLCSCHHSQITIAFTLVEAGAIETIDTVNIGAPASLADLTSPEPVHRPPIG